MWRERSVGGGMTGRTGGHWRCTGEHSAGCDISRLRLCEHPQRCACCTCTVLLDGSCCTVRHTAVCRHLWREDTGCGVARNQCRITLHPRQSRLTLTSTLTQARSGRLDGWMLRVSFSTFNANPLTETNDRLSYDLNIQSDWH